jgi:hypothetical protein
MISGEDGEVASTGDAYFLTWTNENCTEPPDTGGPFVDTCEYYGLIVRYDGTGFHNVAKERDVDFEVIDGNDVNGGVFAAGRRPDLEPVFYKLDGGTFSAVQAQPRDTIEALWVVGPDSVFAVGRNGLVMHYDGERFNEMESGTSAGLRAVWRSL